MLLGGKSVKVRVTVDSGTPSASAMLCAMAARCVVDSDEGGPPSCTTVSTTTVVEPPGCGNEGCTGIDSTTTFVRVPPDNSSEAPCVVPSLESRSLVSAAAEPELLVVICTVIIVLLGGASVNVSVTEETGTPSAVAMFSASVVRSASEYAEGDPASWITLSTTIVEPPGDGRFGCTGTARAWVPVPEFARISFTDADDANWVCMVPRTTAAAAPLSQLTCTVIIVLLGGESTKDSVTDDTGTPSDVAMDSASADLAVEEMAEDGPASCTTDSTTTDVEPPAGGSEGCTGINSTETVAPVLDRS